MAKKAARKDQETCPKCGRRADSLVELADGRYRATHGFKMKKVRSSATGNMIECQVADRVCTNDKAAVFEEEL